MKLLFAKTAEGVKFYPITIAEGVVYKPSTGSAMRLNEFLDSIDYSGKADKVSSATSGNFAGLDSNGNLTDSGSKAADFDAAGAASAAETAAKGYADGLIAALDASESQAAGADGLALSITEVDGVITSISGSIAANTYDAYGDAAQALADAIGSSTDLSSANTIYAAKKYADEAVAAGLVGGVKYQGIVDGTTNPLPSADYKKGYLYVVAANGTYAGKVCQIGDFLIANKDYASGATAANDWDRIQGNVAVSDENASLTIGTAVKIAEIEGVEIHVTQVEDMTKIEAEACGDTSDYADYSSLFTTPSAG